MRACGAEVYVLWQAGSISDAIVARCISAVALGAMACVTARVALYSAEP
jgi:hypothetical protein